MDDDSGMEETPCDLTKPRIAPYKTTWKPQKKKTSSLLHNCEPDGGRIWLGENPLRFDKTSDHAIQEYLETPA